MGFRTAIHKLFAKQEDDAPAPVVAPAEALDRTAREIRGAIFLLLGLFLLVSLVSYLPLDTVHLKTKRLDLIYNLGGMVGAALAEGLLGAVGAAGYLALLLVLQLAWLAFKGQPLSIALRKASGIALCAGLASILSHLIFFRSAPEMSLLQGGWLGRQGGALLRQYFSVTGGILITAGAIVILILVLAEGAAFRSLRELFDNSEEEAPEEDEPSEEAPSAEKTEKKTEETAAPTEKKKPKRKRAKAKDDAGEEGAEPTADGEGESEEKSEEKADGPKDGEFQPVIAFDGKCEIPTSRILTWHDSGAKKPSRGEQKIAARTLVEQLFSFNIFGDVEDISIGPVLSTYEYKPAAGIKLKAIANVQEDLGIAMGTPELRIVAPIPGKTVVGIEVPRTKIEVISLKEIVSQKGFLDKKIRLPVALGKSTTGEPLFADLAGMPHLLVAGATGSGKSVFVNCLIMSLLFRCTPQELRMILIDPKMLELNVFDGLPHLISNVITKSDQAFNALSWAVIEMENRYKLMAAEGSKNIDSYNSKIKNPADRIPYIVIVVDELADLMLSGGAEVETAITRLAQKARAAGIHLVIATQRPSTDVVTGLIKANIPSRLSFKVPSGIDSRTVLDTGGAESLIGRGDSLMIRPGENLQRIHGCYVSEEELKRVVKNVTGGRDHSKYYIDFSKAPAVEE